MGCTSSVPAASGRTATPQRPSVAVAGQGPAAASDGPACTLAREAELRPGAAADGRTAGPVLLDQEKHLSGGATSLPLGKGYQSGSVLDDEDVNDKAHTGALTCTNGGAKAGFDSPAIVATKSTPRVGASRKNHKSYTMPARVMQGQIYNGFTCMKEAPALACKEENIAPHTLPAEALSYEPHPDAVITSWANGDSERKIHNNIRLEDRELERLAMLRGEARAQGAEFSPTVASMATRFLSRARMDPKKALKLMKATQEWRCQYFKDGPVSDESVMEDMAHGIAYFTGRDCALRPAIVIRAIRIPAQWYKEKRIDKFIRVLIFCMEYFLRYMVVPGRVENLSVIVDLKGLSLSQVPLGALGEVYKVMSHHYIGRVFRFYVCNMSSTLSAIAGMAKSILTDRQKQKLTMLEDVSELRKDFALHQLEEDLGGTRPLVAARFFPFPVQAGPFEAGYDGAPNHSSVPDAHQALTPLGAVGRLWDSRKDEEENTKLEFSQFAADILRRCNLTVPPELILQRELSDGVTKAAEMAAAEYNEKRDRNENLSTTSSCCSASSLGDDVGSRDLDDNESDMGYVQVQEAAICNFGGLFCCRA